MSCARQHGFTLMELLVVIVIIVIIVAMAGLRVGGDEYRAVRQESERLALLMQAAQQQAILEGRILAVALSEDGYVFLTLNNERKFELLAGDDILRPYQLPVAMRVDSVFLDGQPASQNEPIVLPHTGELLQSVLIVLVQGQARWHVEGTLDGRILPAAPSG